MHSLPILFASESGMLPAKGKGIEAMRKAIAAVIAEAAIRDVPRAQRDTSDISYLRD
jgi:hypothetical protein